MSRKVLALVVALFTAGWIADIAAGYLDFDRESGERFDPDELQTLARLAHELAIALLWVERDSRPAESRSVSGPEFPSLSP